ncbi:MAG: septum formation initiator family protein [Verrucomicrobiales bacterium]|nr:septum formation initiator family protein [Verrucomicrobiales bacterium]
MSSAASREDLGPGLWGYANRLLMALIVLALLAAAALSYLPLIQQNRKLRAQLEVVKARYEQSDAEYRDLQVQINALQRDPKAVERAARELGMGRPGEIIVRFEPAPAR